MAKVNSVECGSGLALYWKSMTGLRLWASTLATQVCRSSSESVWILWLMVRSRLLRQEAQHRARWVVGDAPEGCWKKVIVSVIFTPVETFADTAFASVNWYQRNYPYAWAGARLVRDIRT